MLSESYKGVKIIFSSQDRNLFGEFSLGSTNYRLPGKTKADILVRFKDVINLAKSPYTPDIIEQIKINTTNNLHAENRLIIAKVGKLGSERKWMDLVEDLNNKGFRDEKLTKRFNVLDKLLLGEVNRKFGRVIKDKLMEVL